ncbi:MAG: polysaccharide biosynthesis tyrosine autokinase [Pseudomonadota bacterium]|nr:polysaccharide biosynthesis tyrosine autokinase [Pseudomonadota bacterium]
MTNGAYPRSADDRGRQLELAAQQKELQRFNEIAMAPRPERDDEDVIDLREYWNVLMRRKWTLITVLAVSMVVALLVSFLSTPIYRSTLLLQIEREEGKVLEYQSLTPEETVNAKDFYQTQYELLQSRSLARRVIDQLGLQTSNSFSQEDEASYLAGLIRELKAKISGSDTAQAPQEPDLEELFLENLNVSPVKNSRLVRINYESPDPEEAAAIANAVADNFVNTTLERRFDASSYAKTFLEERIQQVRANLEDSERRLIAYAREREIVNLDDKLDILMQKLKEMSSQLVMAEAQRIEAEAEYQEMAEDDGAGNINVLESPVIQKLKERKAELESEYQEKLRIYKPGYPKMQQLQQQIAEIRQEIAQESASIGNSVRTTFEAKIRQEAKLQMRIGEIKDEILALQDRSTDYQTLKREVDTNRELYDGLLQRMKEIGVAAGIGTNNISIVDAAEVPRLKYKPSLTKNLAIAIALGLFGGVLLAFLFETLDDTVKTSEDVEKRVGAPVLGVIPLSHAKEHGIDEEDMPLLASKDPKSPLAEAFRSLRASLIFSTAEGAPKVMHFTSPSPGEGKTTSATSTAITFAQTGSKVLLIDADLRNPSLHRAFSLHNSSGLTNYLAGDSKAAEIAQPTQVPRLFAITSGPLPPNPVELLSSAKMLDLVSLAADRFDYVIIDGPPVIGLADALVLANLASATLFVVESGGTRASPLEGSIKRLRAANAVILGAVLEKFGRGGSGYGYGYSYDYHYTYNYGGGAEEAALPKQAST